MSSVSPVAAAFNFSQVKQKPTSIHINPSILSTSKTKENKFEAALSQIFDKIDYNINNYFPNRIQPSFFEPKIDIKVSPRNQSFFEQTQTSEQPFNIKPIPTEVINKHPSAQSFMSPTIPSDEGRELNLSTFSMPLRER